MTEKLLMHGGVSDTNQTDKLLELCSNDSRIKEAFEVHGRAGRGDNLKSLSVYPRAEGEQSIN